MTKNEANSDLRFQAISATLFFVIIFYGLDYLGVLGWVRVGLTAIASTLGFWLGHQIRLKPMRIKIIFLFACLLTFSSVIYIIPTYFPHGIFNNEESISNYILEGIWMSDDSDNVTVRFRFEGENVYISMSPNYEETKYRKEMNNGNLLLLEDDEIIFDWRFTVLRNMQIELEADGESLLLTKVDSL